MIQHRCPWCGEKIPFHLPIKGLWNLGNPDVCPKCKRLYTSNTGRNSVIILVAGMIGAYIAAFFMQKFNHAILNWILGIAGLILLAAVFAELCRVPYARYIGKEERPWISRKRSAEIRLSWEKHEREGLFLPRFQVLNGEIFPACFMDADGVPISTPFCVVLTGFLWSDHDHCACKLHFVLDDAPEEKLLRKGNRFCLYHRYRKVAKGVIEEQEG